MSSHASSARAVAVLIAIAQLGLGVPVAAAVPHAATRPARTPPVFGEATAGATANRTVPPVTPPASVFTLPAMPTDAELSGAHIFSEPLIPLPRGTTPAENRALATALRAYAAQHRSELVGPILEFVATHPQSAWRASLLANLGTVYRDNGYLSRALNAWDLAWTDAGAETDQRARAVADFALGEWFELSHKLGRVPEIVQRLDQVKDRPLSGRAAQKIALAREGVRVTRVEHDVLVSGAAAIESVLAYTAYTTQARHVPVPAVQNYHASAAGMSLDQVKALAAQAGLKWNMLFRPSGARYSTPSIVHFRSNHFVAVVASQPGRYLVIDPAMGGVIWVSQAALEDEGSGYVLAPASAATSGWRTVPASEAVTIVGHCLPGAPDDNDPGQPPTLDGGPPSEQSPGDNPPSPNGPPPCDGCCGMPQYELMRMSASLRLSDSPLTYGPAIGPRATFYLTYNQREGNQPQVFSYGNLGPKWTFGWLSWVSDDPNSDNIEAAVYLQGGGSEFYTDGNPHPDGVYPAHWRSRAVLAKVSADPVRYERRLPDGSVQVFSQSDGVITSGRHVYLTDAIDPRGLAVHFTYDASLRLVAVTDAAGLVTTLSYDLASDPLKITKITDPYGRFAALGYDASGRLTSTTDGLGLRSSLVYGDDDDFVASMTTPYGTTVFTHETDPQQTNSFRFVQATDPLGASERVEFHWSDASIPSTASAPEVPTGFDGYNNTLDHYNSLYWNKRAMALGAGDESKATITHWLLYTFTSYLPVLYSHGFSTSVPHSVKRPLEHRTWYAYPDELAGGTTVGSFSQATTVARVLDDGTSRIAQASYNPMGNAGGGTDPVGRQTSDTYAANGTDLLEVRRTSGGLNDLLASYGSYTSQHQPQTVADAAGQTTTFTYNAFGQPLTITNAKSETTTLAYDADHHLASVTEPLTGAVTTYTYDAYGRVHTVTDADGYVITKDYDAFDRPTRVTHPDGTSEATTYDRLDVATQTDRLGRTTRYFHDALRRLILTRDPGGRAIVRRYCACGSLDGIIDANGHATTWERDLEGRVTREVRGDSTTATIYMYETTSSRLKTVTDPKGQVTTYTYNLDDSVQQVAFTNAAISTPTVSYTYDANYPRVATMTDGTGTTTYGYHAPGDLGAGQVASVDGPLTDDTITYSYDELGRVISRAINDVAASQTYDALGRTTVETNVLGTFTYGYDGVTRRLASVSYPNGQTSAYTYFDNAGDHRLQTIHHKYPDGSTLSQFDYTYDAAANILTWRQQADTTAVVWDYGYDAANQLTSAVKTSDPDQTVLQRFAYAYDPAGNRTSEQIDDAVTSASYDPLNRLTSQQAGGALVFKGSLDEPASVTINGKPAIVTPDSHFQGTAAVSQGTSTVTVQAVDPSGNTATAVYQVDQASSSQPFTYDANGNLTSDGTRTFTWDAENRLLSVTSGTHTSTFTYDGLSRRVETVEADSGTTTSDTKFLWCGLALCEARDSTGGTVAKRYFARGVQDAGTAYFYTRDHLRSVRELTDSSGTVRARYDYDPWGRQTKGSGDRDADIGFAGHFEHSVSGLAQAPYRAYDPTLGRWIAQDPLEFLGGSNWYSYVSNEPTLFVDPLGLCDGSPDGGAPPNGSPSGGCDQLCQIARDVSQRAGGLTDPETYLALLAIGAGGGGLGLLAGSDAAAPLVPLVETWAAQHPDAVQGVQDFLSGLTPTPPAPSLPGYLGSILSWLAGQQPHQQPPPAQSGKP